MTDGTDGVDGTVGTGGNDAMKAELCDDSRTWWYISLTEIVEIVETVKNTENAGIVESDENVGIAGIGETVEIGNRVEHVWCRYVSKLNTAYDDFCKL